ncbi:MAG TPA: TIGR03013 family XrtA/PEP-CTERM system glycosyltransferase [Noviherbaspirillum sp.]|nr:TIGR03013 family XrtA/PEP-CTERM system glycosyltransferase [Noviherbaspirillum sp.]
MVKIFNHYVSKLVSALLLIEIFLLIASMYLGRAVRFLDSSRLPPDQFENFFASASAFALVMVFSMSAFGMYQLERKPSTANTFLRLMPSVALGFCILTLFFYLVPDLYVGRGILGLSTILAAALLLCARVLIFKTFKLGFLESRVIFLGEGALAKECSHLASRNRGYNKYAVVGFAPMPTEERQVASSAILPTGESLASMAKKYSVKEIVVSVQNRRGADFPLQDLLECKLNGIKVTGAAAFFEREACQIRLDSLHPSWLIFGDGFDQSALRAIGKRLFDLVVSALIFMVSLPVMLLTALCIFLEDRGPIFYRQERVGKDGHTFWVMKFRSMGNDAEKEGKPQWAVANDARTTKVGRIIRKLRIDELPQILNVLKGEMSFVGPRPERPYFVKQLCEKIPYYNMRHSIKPGITGFAQVRYHYGASIEDAVQKLQYDLYYVKNHGLFLDLLILIETLQVVLFAKGSR